MQDVTDEQLPRGAGSAGEIEARPAASTIVLRGDPFEVLFLRRTATSTFVPDAWVYPGGAVDEIDRKIASERGGDLLNQMRLCAARELFEEAGIWIGTPIPGLEERRQAILDDDSRFADLVSESPPDVDRLVWTSRWVTPIGVPRRYDTFFFLLHVPDGTMASAEEREGVEVVWLSPAAALDRHRAGSFTMVFPTIRNLEALIPFTSPRELIASREGVDVPTTRPVLVVDGDRKRIELPDPS
ncbi:MAG TPA: NUDIX domain-containing protein [Thermoanaerobaculia bacterium]|nr:NUDIX domain-containing protein [Thermoanaerobaculia bacterium]